MGQFFTYREYLGWIEPTQVIEKRSYANPFKNLEVRVLPWGFHCPPITLRLGAERSGDPNHDGNTKQAVCSARTQGKSAT
jgi:hypothetical protein